MIKKYKRSSVELKCKNCDIEMVPALITYKRKIFGKNITIPKVEGYVCRECDYTKVDPIVEKGLTTKILEKTMERRQDIDVKPILINCIKRVREEKGISQKRIGKTLNFTEQRFGAIERNDNTPTVYLAHVIADILGVDINELYRLVHIPAKFHEELRNWDKNFKPIEGLAEVRAKIDELTEKQNELRREKREIIKKIKASKRVGEKIEKNESYNENDILSPEEIIKLENKISLLEKEDNEIKKEKEPYIKKLNTLSKDVVLKQGCCLDIDDWERILKKFPTKIIVKEFEGL